MLNTGTNTRRNKHHYKVNVAKLVSSLYYKKVMRNTFSLKQKSIENQQTATADILFLAGTGDNGQTLWNNTNAHTQARAAFKKRTNAFQSAAKPPTAVIL